MVQKNHGGKQATVYGSSAPARCLINLTTPSVALVIGESIMCTFEYNIVRRRYQAKLKTALPICL